MAFIEPMHRNKPNITYLLTGPPPVARRVRFDHVPETPEPVPQVPSCPPQAKIQNSSGAQSAQKQDGYSSFGRKIKKTVRMDL